MKTWNNLCSRNQQTCNYLRNKQSGGAAKASNWTLWFCLLSHIEVHRNQDKSFDFYLNTPSHPQKLCCSAQQDTSKRRSHFCLLKTLQPILGHVPNSLMFLSLAVTAQGKCKLCVKLFKVMKQRNREKAIKHFRHSGQVAFSEYHKISDRTPHLYNKLTSVPCPY